MSVSAGTVYVDVKPDTSAMTGKSSGLGKAMATAGILAAGAFAVSFVKGGIEQAQEAEKIGLAFHDSFERGTENLNADAFDRFFDRVNNAMGVTDEEMQQWAQHFNAAIDFTKFGLDGAGENLRKFTMLIPDLMAKTGKSGRMLEKTLIKLGTDPELAIESLRRLGSISTETADKAMKMVEAGKVQAAQQMVLNEAYKRSAGAAKAQTTESEKLTIAWDELQEKLGTALMPVLNDLFQHLTGLITFFTSGSTASKVMIATMVGLVSVLGLTKLALFAHSQATNVARVATGIWSAVTKVQEGLLLKTRLQLLALTVQQKAQAAASKIAAAMQWAWNAAMSANPIGLIIAAIVAAIAVVVLLWKKNEGFRNFVLAAWGVIKSFILEAWNKIKTVGVAVWNFIKKAASVWWNGVKAYINAFKIVFTAVFNVVKKVASVVWNAIKAYAQAWWAGVRVIFGAFKAYFSAVFNGVKAIAQGVWNGIKSIVTGAWNGIKSAWNGAKDFFTGIWNGVEEAAKGVFNGIASAWNSTVGSISFSIPDWVPKIGGNTFSIPDIPLLAEGGIAMGPTLAMIGERGPEAVVPLSGGGMTVRIVDSNLGLVMEGQLSTDRRYAESRGRANR